MKCNMKIEMEWNFRYVYLQSQLTKGLVENIRKNVRKVSVFRVHFYFPISPSIIVLH